uniref:Fibrinogen C-terminal domain-containing protein n=1 Tax=Amphimedon queenslandica TaxID=400682 RepID=A0A1X7TTS0_AMPQE
MTQLRVDLGDFEGNTAYSNYSTFSVSDGSTEYILTVGGYSSTAGDSLGYHNGRRFSTRDNDNDLLSEINCAQTHTDAWWYNTYYHTNLNGHYFNTETYNIQLNNRGYVYLKNSLISLKFTEMKTSSKN